MSPICESSSFLIFLMILILSGAAGVARADQAPLKVFVLAGQSNMYGNGAAVVDLPADLAEPQKNVLVFQDGAWVPLEPGKAPDENGRNFGPEVTFGQAMANHFGQTVGIIKLGVGGTNLAVDWALEGKHSLYLKLVKTVTEARKSRPIIVVGMLWMQGEADSVHQEMAKAYSANLTHLIDSARRDFDNPSLPFACGRVNPPNLDRYQYQDLVRDAQATISLPGYRMIDCDDLPKYQDHLHYNAAGQMELGKRFAAAMIELLKAATTQKADR